MQRFRKEFTKWLRSHDAHAIVGVACETRACPIATFCHIKRPHEVEVDGMEIVEYPGCRPFFELPIWAREFIEEVDTINGTIHAFNALNALGMVSYRRRKDYDYNEHPVLYHNLDCDDPLPSDPHILHPVSTFKVAETV